MKLLHGYYLHPSESLENDFPTEELQVMMEEAASLRGYDIHKDLEIGWTDQTQKAMKTHRMVYRPNPLGFTIWMQVKEEANDRIIPFVPFENPFRLTFFLRLKNSAFLNFTDLGALSLREELYHFSNLSGNWHAGTEVFYLNQAQGVRYASEADRIARIAALHAEDVSSLRLSQVRIEMLDEYRRSAYNETFKKDPEAPELKLCRLDLRKLPTGKYTLIAYSSLDNEKYRKEVFLNRGDLPPTIFSVLQWLHTPGVSSGPNAFLDEEGGLRRNVYALWWKNRKTRWRYHFNKAQAPASEACDVRRDENLPDGRIMVTKEMLPLTHRYRNICYQLDDPNTPFNDTILLPNPEPDRIYPEGQTVYSEVYMGEVELGKVI